MGHLDSDIEEEVEGDNESMRPPSYSLVWSPGNDFIPNRHPVSCNRNGMTGNGPVMRVQVSLFAYIFNVMVIDFIVNEKQVLSVGDGKQYFLAHSTIHKHRTQPMKYMLFLSLCFGCLL